jgi:hypothetical protein
MKYIKNASEATVFIQNAQISHADQWEKIDNTEAYLLHGQAPFDDKELEADGQDWRPNYNYGKGRSEVEQGVINNQTDIYRSFGFIDVEFESYDKKKHKKPIHGFLLDDYIREVLKRTISASFINCIEEDERTHSWISQIEYWSYTFGYCPVLRHDWSYLGDPVPLTSIAFEDRTKIGQVRNFVVFDSLKVDDVYNIYIECKGKEKTRVEYLGEEYHIYPNGWIDEGMKDIIKSKIDSLNLDEDYEPLDKTKGKKQLLISTWDHIDEFVTRKGVSWLTYNTNNIFIGKIFQYISNNEFVETHCICDTGISREVRIESSTARKYLVYQKEHKKKRLSQILNMVKEYGVTKDTYISSLTGAGKYIAQEALRYDVKRNTIEAKLIISGSPFFQSQNSLTGKMSKIKVCAGFNVVGDDMVLLPNQVRYDINDHMAALQMEKQEYSERVFHYNPRLDLSSRPTTDEVTVKGQEVSSQKRSKVPVKLADYSRLFTECLFDLVTKEYDNDENKLIQDKFFEYIQFYLMKYSIELTKEQVKDIVRSIKQVKLNAAHGDPGSIKEAMEVVSTSEQRKHLTIMYLLALGFSRKNAWDYVEAEEYGDQVDKAAMENQMFYTTSEVSVGRHQDALTHLNTHFAKADRILKGVVGGEDPVRGFNWITNCLINTAKHIEIIQSNPFYNKQARSFTKLQAYFEGKAKLLAQAVEQLKQQEQQRAQQNVEGQQQAQRQQGLDPKLAAEIERDRIKMLDKIERTNILTQNAAERKREMFELEKELSKGRNDSNIAMQKEMAELRKELTLMSESIKLAKQ